MSVAAVFHRFRVECPAPEPKMDLEATDRQPAGFLHATLSASSLGRPLHCFRDCGERTCRERFHPNLAENLVRGDPAEAALRHDHGCQGAWLRGLRSRLRGNSHLDLAAS